MVIFTRKSAAKNAGNSKELPLTNGEILTGSADINSKELPLTKAESSDASTNNKEPTTKVTLLTKSSLVHINDSIENLSITLPCSNERYACNGSEYIVLPSTTYGQLLLNIDDHDAAINELLALSMTAEARHLYYLAVAYHVETKPEWLVEFESTSL